MGQASVFPFSFYLRVHCLKRHLFGSRFRCLLLFTCSVFQIDITFFAFFISSPIYLTCLFVSGVFCSVAMHHGSNFCQKFDVIFIFFLLLAFWGLFEREVILLLNYLRLFLKDFDCWQLIFLYISSLLSDRFSITFCRLSLIFGVLLLSGCLLFRGF